MSKNDLVDNVVRVDFRERSRLKPEPVASSKDKQELFSEWIGHGTVSVLFDARKSDVKVPLEFSRQGDLRLNFSYDFHVADFNFNQVGIWATLSFDSGEHFCMVPWTSVYGMQSIRINQGAVWFEDFPKDYDQEDVLGFSEQQTESVSEHNVVKFITSEE